MIEETCPLSKVRIVRPPPPPPPIVGVTVEGPSLHGLGPNLKSLRVHRTPKPDKAFHYTRYTFIKIKPYKPYELYES